MWNKLKQQFRKFGRDRKGYYEMSKNGPIFRRFWPVALRRIGVSAGILIADIVLLNCAYVTEAWTLAILFWAIFALTASVWCAIWGFGKRDSLFFVNFVLWLSAQAVPLYLIVADNLDHSDMFDGLAAGVGIWLEIGCVPFILYYLARWAISRHRERMLMLKERKD